ncbi:MAG: NADPH:quinone oxidoreductase family protein [Albidovulum sp.]|nr:NADPH:quinone oxidoreductase family protein [Albidovulum sp.]MDE0533659.1 NADPH:quinone oxidoreductase family protein [Albidovulum sp.]
MRAMLITELGGPAELKEVPVPEPGEGEVLLRILAVGMNFADLLIAKGAYQVRPALPFALGMEACGIVEQKGAAVENFSIGQRVAVFGSHGALSEYACYPAANCTAIPDSMSHRHAACFQVAYGTTHVALEYRARLRSGERLLVLGASGGVGRTAIEIGRLLGAEVIAAARGAEKLAVAEKAGAHHLLDSEAVDIREAVKRLGGADVVYDPVGGDQFYAAMRATNPDGRLIPLGFASGDIPKIPANILLVKNLTVIGFFWGGYMNYKPEVPAESMKTLFSWYEDRRICPHVSAVFDLQDANLALEKLRNRSATGRLVVEVGKP